MAIKTMRTFFHATTHKAARAILREGFRDRTGSYGFVGMTVSGVWVADRPLGAEDSVRDDVVFQVDIGLTDDEMMDFEVVEESGLGAYREWLIPAETLNKRGTITQYEPGIARHDA